MQEFDREGRDQLILSSLLERRLTVEEELRRLGVQASELSRREADLKAEIATLDGILGVVPEVPPSPTPASEPLPSVDESLTAPHARKRRRKGSRREQMLPRIREAFGTGIFEVEGVLDVLLKEEPGDRRKAYFAAWALVRDLTEDGVVAIVTEHGTGPRKKRTFRFAEAASSALDLGAPEKPATVAVGSPEGEPRTSI